MGKRNFDLAAAIAGIVSNSDTGMPEVRMIDIGDIIPNKGNFYGVRDLKPLMDSIVMDGLHHYPLVMKHPEQEGKWLLVDGERRYTACQKLVEEGHEALRKIPCTVKDYSSAAFARLQLILSNSTNRVLSNAEIMKQAEETEMLLYQLKEEGHEFPGRMRDQVAAACNVSASKLARLKVIREKLFTDFMYLFEKNKLSEQAAYALARMPDGLQMRIAGLMKGEPLDGAKAEKILSRSEDGWEWLAADLKCPDGKACPGADRFLRRDLEAQSFAGLCGGNKCCLTCDLATASYNPCERMCSKAQKQRSDRKAEADAERAKVAAKRAIPHQEKTQRNAQRIVKAIDAAGLMDDDLITWRYSSLTVGTIRKWADGEFEEGGHWSEPSLEPKHLYEALNAAVKLKCSADYLLGLTDNLNPTDMELKWKSPDYPPVPDRKVVAKFRLPGEEEVCQKIVKWNGEDWCFTSGAVIDIVCLGWWPIPEDE